MLTLYYNPRCRKSREALELIAASGKDVQVIDYQKTPLTKTELRELIQKLGISAEALIRKNETLWKTSYRDKNLTDEACLQIMLEHPRLMERPILATERRAVICRPPEICEALIKTQ